MKVMVCEIVRHYHEVELDDELNAEDVVQRATDDSCMYDTGYEAIETYLQAYKDKYGFDYKVKPNACGTEVAEMYVVEEID